MEGFGLTIKGRALAFQTLKTAKYSSFTTLAKEFVVEHTKSVLKKNVLSQIYQFKQGSSKTIRDCVSYLGQYLTRCPNAKISSQEWLVSIFLEGLCNQELHLAVYMS